MDGKEKDMIVKDREGNQTNVLSRENLPHHKDEEAEKQCVQHI